MAKRQENTFNDDDQRLRAVFQRDPRADDVFWYAVQTTGIYCRPTCPSRRPRAKNLKFFDSPAQAEDAGYRPCKRCRPDQPAAPGGDEKIAMACRLMEESDDAPRLAALARQAGVSPFHFHRLFKQTLGITPKEYADAIRLRRLQKGLENGPDTVTDTLYQAGFGSSSRLYEKSDQLLGMTPGQYRMGGHRVEIQYAVAETRLGWLMVAMTRKGVCSLEMGDSPRQLLDGLRRRFTKASIRPGVEGFGRLLGQITAFLDTPEKGLDLPLDIQGTSFQKRVWEALQKIPAGRTVTYSELAERLGAPRAARAVARAVASNHIALAVPCHRVIRKDGGLGGYRWGLKRKAQLLELESEQ